MNVIKTALLSMVLVVVGATTAAAQVVPPSNVEAGVLNRRNLQDFSEDKYFKENNMEVEIAPAALPQPAVDKRFTVFVKAVVFEGNTVYDDEKLRGYTEELAGKAVSFADIQAVYLKITDLYREDGYLTSFAYLPNEPIKDGVVKIRVFEGKVGNVLVKNNRWAKDRYLYNTILEKNDMAEDEVFNVANLKKSLGEVNDTGYLKGKIQLQRGSIPQTTDIVLDVEERTPLGFGVLWDNFGSRLIGNQRAVLTNEFQNLTGYGDKFSVRNSFAENSYGLGLNYELPVNSLGTKFVAGYSLTAIELGEEYKKYNIEGNSQGFQVGFVHPLYSGNRLNVVGNLFWDMLESETTLRNMELDDYCLRVVRTGVNATYDDNKGRWIGGINTDFGISGFGAHNTGGYGAGRTDFVKFTPSVVRVHSLPKETLALIRTSAQFTNNPLKSAEQMSLGGANTVRGFREGALLGDAGYFFSVELRKSVPYMPEVLKLPYWKDRAVKLPVKDRLEFVTFYDQGWAREIRKGYCEHSTSFLQSVGLGIRYALTEYVSAKVDMGIPLGKKRFSSQNDVRVHFALTSDVVGSLRSFIDKKKEAL